MTNKVFKKVLRIEGPDPYDNMEYVRQGAGVAYDDGKVYVFGGVDNSLGYYVNCEIYDFATKEKTHGANLSLAREELFACGNEDGFIYLFGGVRANSGGYYNTAQKYDVDNDSYSSLTNYPVACKDIHGCSYSGNIYLAGGDDGVNWLTNFYRYNVVANTYSTLASLPVGSKDGSLVQLGAYMYYIGGSISNGAMSPTSIQTNKIHRYDISGNSWTANYDTLPTNRTEFGAVVYDSKIYIAGGVETSSADPKTDVLEYEPVGKTFTTFGSIDASLARGECGGILYNDAFYLFTGYGISDRVTGTINKIDLI